MSLNLKKIIQDLQQIDLKNTNLNIDFKKINMKSIEKNLLKRKDVLINIVIILVTLFVIRGIFSSRQKVSQNIQQEITRLEEKSSAIKSYETQEKLLTNFIKTSQDGYSSATAVINTISEIAQASDIKIISFVPSKLQSFNDYTEQTIKFVFSGSFENMLRFIYKVEHYEKNFRIDTWAKTETFQTMLSPNKNKNDETISWQMVITSINLKE